MTKYYVIPIDNNGIAYLGIKSANNPYNNRPAWGAGAPNVFGGNSDNRSVKDTAYFEAREESHFKIDIDINKANFVQVHSHETMTFYVIRDRFVYEPNTYFNVTFFDEEKSKKYRETTGQVMLVSISELYTTSSDSVADNVLAAQRMQGLAGEITADGQIAFRGSAACEAIRQAALRVKNNTL